MKLCVFSDTHLGFGQDTEREQECFENVEKALKLCFEQKADCILLPGDVFDEAIPSQETWKETFRVFSAVKGHAGNVSVTRVKNAREEELNVSHVPIIAIHGTHEFRGKRFANALEVMEKAGFLFYLHAGYVEVRKGSESIAIHGLGGVPEKKALDALKSFNPVPLKGKRNILVLHQSIKELLPFGDEMTASIGFDDIPKGFDLVMNGHFHLSMSQDLGDGNRFFIPGSTIITQMKRLESENPKGVTVFDTVTMEREFFPLLGQRRLLHETLLFENSSVGEVKVKVQKRLGELLDMEWQLKPLVRIKLKGSLANGVSSSDISLQEIIAPFQGKAIISIDKDFSTGSFKKKIEELRLLQKDRKSIASIGLELLESNLKITAFDSSIDVRELFELLEQGKTDDVILLLSGKKK